MLNKNSIENFISKSIRDVENDEEFETITKIIEKSEGIVNENIIKVDEDNEEEKKKVLKIITEVIKKNPKKAIEIFEKNKTTKNLSNNIKTKIEKGEAITVDEFDKVFKNNISPN